MPSRRRSSAMRHSLRNTAAAIPTTGSISSTSGQRRPLARRSCMRTVPFAMLLGLLVAANAGAADDNLDRVMALLAQRTHGHVSFVEEDHLALLERPVRSSGELFYDRPDRLEKRTLAPRPRSLILEHGSDTVQAGG